jgi:deoxyadenosine/deoxycytidine kinase
MKKSSKRKETIVDHNSGFNTDRTEVKYIAIEGVIGAGKTSLAKKIKERLNAELILEQFEANPFLESFYSDRRRYAFQTQMFFLINRYKQQELLNQENLFTDFYVCDYIFEKDRIFAYLNLNGEELKLYESIFPLLARNLRKPDLVVYLQSSVDRLMYNIKKRSRRVERNLTRSYIEELSDSYNHYFFRYNSTPLLIVNSTEIDFVKSSSDFDELFNQIFREDRGIIEYFKPESKRII